MTATRTPAPVANDAKFFGAYTWSSKGVPLKTDACFGALSHTFAAHAAGAGSRSSTTVAVAAARARLNTAIPRSTIRMDGTEGVRHPVVPACAPQLGCGNQTAAS
ncbi:hypothetical protein Ate02nite_50360 [Paractinoplanes tereljensis]|uniref:Uncharacterized protein n=1 Tax=Paractinoplanes tereljensis TaxID=571912 RepID=A0A919NNU7_9ACTN|nr:hypothetical protein Ate02nite_50360 [Actinoplanes tereljensis]